jgi:hypothetical protein
MPKGSCFPQSVTRDDETARASVKLPKIQTETLLASSIGNKISSFVMIAPRYGDV